MVAMATDGAYQVTFWCSADRAASKLHFIDTCAVTGRSTTRRAGRASAGWGSSAPPSACSTHSTQPSHTADQLCETQSSAWNVFAHHRQIYQAQGGPGRCRLGLFSATFSPDALAHVKNFIPPEQEVETYLVPQQKVGHILWGER
jgi:hypothetical protein